MRCFIFLLLMTCLVSCQGSSPSTIDSPATFEAEILPGYQVKLTWSNVAQAQRFYLDRKEGNGAFEDLTSLEQGNEFIDKSVEPLTP